jgi:hypothetical protein
MKQETIEEFARNAYKKHSVNDAAFSLEEKIQRNGAFVVGFKEGFVEGAKSDASKEYWFKIFQEQDKNNYSEEEVETIAKDAYSMGRNNILIGVFNKWFEQFKKKQ